MHAEYIDSTLSAATGPRPGLNIFRVLGIAAHLARGFATAALVFPFASPATRLAFARRWARQMIRTLGAQLCVEGAAPAPGALLVANHVSWLDILAIASHMPAVFVAKSEVRNWPAIGWLAARAGTLFLKRSSGRSLLRIKNRVGALLLAGRNVALFPEGTTTNGSGVLPFRSGLLQAAIDGARPVQPVAIAYYGDDGNPVSDPAFIDGMTLWQSIDAICRSGRISVRLALAAPLAAAGRTRKELAREAHDMIAAILAQRPATHPAWRGFASCNSSRRRAGPVQPIAHAIPSALLKAEIECLPAEHRLVESSQFIVQYAHAAQIPWCLQEIGRLREHTFRAAGEGTGKACDIDLFDAYYLHLFVWDRHAEAIVGAYRMGLTDEILARYGKRGLYTQSLFKYGPQLLQTLNPAIELGRSFVRTEYQRSFSPLMLLWRGIGRFVLRSPHYAVLFGPVSISNSYAPISRQLMVDYLRTNNSETKLARHVKPRHPFRARRSTVWDEVEVANLKDIEHLSRVIARIEHDKKGVPILLKQYLKLGGRLLGFNADDQFSDALDGLIMVDLRTSEPRVLARYMGEEGAAAFLAHNGTEPEFLRWVS
jgi:1-acyl-sn-glycerol-3-phosphate acyltransferase